MARNHKFRIDSGYMEELRFRSHPFGTSVEGFNSLSRNHRDHPYVSDVVVDTLSDQFSSLSLLPPPKPRRVPTLPSSLQCLRSNGPKADLRLYGERSMLESFYELHLSRIRNRKNESQQDRAKVLQKQEARLHSRGLVHRNCNVLRESVGTGVFHPLHRPTTTSTQTFNSLKKPTKAEQRKRNQSDKNEFLTKARRGVMTTASTRQEEQQKDECHYHLPPDMDFSKDWTF
ncbi:PREDICTED: uncharacterized protein LOC104792369 [Camelina sativa]|uniref:Uncharacterized protein LOC104792369 n=1 Tax=Camelina sativa TaxID=90675 RepID=A0ABM0ZJX8_CAMSA|nr:PREDICTED: uncharacterized protein LOC104792369 [Camelina sativa]